MTKFSSFLFLLEIRLDIRINQVFCYPIVFYYYSHIYIFLSLCLIVQYISYAINTKPFTNTEN